VCLFYYFRKNHNIHIKEFSEIPPPTSASSSGPSTPEIPPPMPASHPEPSSRYENLPAAATDVWYFMRPLQTRKEPADSEKPKNETPLTRKPSAPCVGCKLCEYVDFKIKFDTYLLTDILFPFQENMASLAVQ
jgi:hypothetical protein